MEPASISSEQSEKDRESSALVRRGSSSSLASEKSDTSTLKYGQEPWTEFSKRVEALCEALWPPPRSAISRIESSKAAKYLHLTKFFRSLPPSRPQPIINRLTGGDNNRVTGITLNSPHNTPNHQLILRTPRELENGARPDRDVAMLKYVRDHSSIPVATVVGQDFTCDNPLESPYVLQDRIPGEDLEKFWPKLSHTQRCTVAVEVGRVIRDLLAMETPINGILDAVDGDTSPSTIIPFELKDSCGELVEEPESSIASSPYSAHGRRTTLDFFTTQFNRWRAVDLDSNCGAPDHLTEIWDKVLKVVKEMDGFNLFKPSLNCVCHTDLSPRNIMAQVQPDQTLKITAILDWDEAVFAPKCIACKPPLWLWDPGSEDRLDDDGKDPWPCELRGADDEPHEEERAELKRLFEEAAGDEYRELAYKPHWRLCRGMFRMAMVGLTASENFGAAERVCREWEELRLSIS